MDITLYFDVFKWYLVIAFSFSGTLLLFILIHELADWLSKTKWFKIYKD